MSSSRLALLTGASSGIGAAVGRRLAAEGFELVCLSRRAPRIEAGAAALRHVAVDLRQRAVLLAALGELTSQLRREGAAVDVVVHAAGCGHFASLEELSAQQIGEVVEVNLMAPMLITRALAPLMKRSGKGHLVFVGSESALRGGRQGTAYCASKFGLRGFAKALRHEVARAGLRVTTVHPGMVRTAFFDELGFEPGAAPEHALEADHVAELVLAAITLPASAVVDEIEVSPLQQVVRKKKSRSEPKVR